MTVVLSDRRAGKESLEAVDLELGDKSDSVIKALANLDSAHSFVSSSFQTRSLPLLKMLSLSGNQMPVIFIDTGYHFPETLTFVSEVSSLLNLNLQVIGPESTPLRDIQKNGRLLFAVDPDACCNRNKVGPLEPILREKEIWVSGLQASQSPFRASLQVWNHERYDTWKFLPLLDWTPSELDLFAAKEGLPVHPLESEGHHSIGCQPCTFFRSLSQTGERGADSSTRDFRWMGSTKTECGLHLQPPMGK